MKLLNIVQITHFIYNTIAIAPHVFVSSSHFRLKKTPLPSEAMILNLTLVLVVTCSDSGFYIDNSCMEDERNEIKTGTGMRHSLLLAHHIFPRKSL